ncbi:AIR synthase related protein [Pseudomonas alliivorans]|nr:AIR synthase related protein [Pseudomonas alliivorans]
MDLTWAAKNGRQNMEQLEQTVSDLGEIRLLQEVILPDVSANQSSQNDDCALIQVPQGALLWSMDPCPTPVADWFGKASPEVWGCYTAAINLSDIAASGGRPIGMLVSMEMPDDTAVSFVRGFQAGLMATLKGAGAKLLGGNVKSAKKFSATGTILGAAGDRAVTRKIDSPLITAYLVGPSGAFWSSVVANFFGASGLSTPTQQYLDNALCFPRPQVEAGIALGRLPFSIACMDCSDGPANAMYQLSQLNKMDITLFADPVWSLSEELMLFLSGKGISLENACYSFGDWQLACLVPDEFCALFETALSHFSLTKLGQGHEGSGHVTVEDGRTLQPCGLNQNFQGGYNSVNEVEELIELYLRRPIFE